MNDVSSTSMTPELAFQSAASAPARSQQRQSNRCSLGEISRLNDLGYSMANVQAFLKTVGVTESRTAVHNYVKKLGVAREP